MMLSVTVYGAFISAAVSLRSSGLMLVLSADLLLWLNAVTEETVHEEMELERDYGLHPANASQLGGAGTRRTTRVLQGVLWLFEEPSPTEELCFLWRQLSRFL